MNEPLVTTQRLTGSDRNYPTEYETWEVWNNEHIQYTRSRWVPWLWNKGGWKFETFDLPNEFPVPELSHASRDRWQKWRAVLKKETRVCRLVAGCMRHTWVLVVDLIVTCFPYRVGMFCVANALETAIRDCFVAGISKNRGIVLTISLLRTQAGANDVPPIVIYPTRQLTILRGWDHDGVVRAARLLCSLILVLPHCACRSASKAMTALRTCRPLMSSPPPWRCDLYLIRC